MPLTDTAIRKAKPGEGPVRLFDGGGLYGVSYSDPRWRGRTVIANPLFGTTTDQIAALFVLLGDERARAFMQGLHENGVKVSPSNGDSADLVAHVASPLERDEVPGPQVGEGIDGLIVFAESQAAILRVRRHPGRCIQ